MLNGSCHENEDRPCTPREGEPLGSPSFAIFSRVAAVWGICACF